MSDDDMTCDHHDMSDFTCEWVLLPVGDIWVQIQKYRKRSVHVRTCTDLCPLPFTRAHCFVEATYHIGLCSCNKFEHNQFARSQDIEARYARAHVHSDTP